MLVSAIALTGFVLQVLTFGSPGLQSAAVGALIGAASFLPFYLLEGMAAGDVKLMAATCAWLSPELAASAVVATYLSGSVLGAVFWISGRRSQGVPYALAIAIGTLLAVLLAKTGFLLTADPVNAYPQQIGVSP